MNIKLICTLALNLWTQGQEAAYASRLDAMQDVCEDVTTAAEKSHMSPYMAASMAWVESRFTANARSPEGAIGPLQVIPYWACPNRRAAGCNLIQAGVDAYLSWLARYKNPREALCHYNTGSVCKPAGRGYAANVERRAKELEKRVKECNDVCEYACGC